MIRRNIIANYLGTAWSVLMGFLFIPLYIKYLGAEAYGVVGISVVLQSYLALLDLGLTPMMGREMARFTAGAHDAAAIRSLLRIIELVMWSTSALAVLLLWLAADWIASEWLRRESLPTADIAHALRILAAVIGMRFVEGMYRSCLVGLQFQVTANVISSTAATLRGAGAIAVLAWWSPTLTAFFWWQGAVSLASLMAFALSAYRLLPAARASIWAGIEVLRGTWKFAGGMLVSSLLGLLLTQTDKVLLTRLLSLTDYGKYTLSLAIVGGVSMAAGPIGQAMYPRLTGLYARGGDKPLVKDFHRSAQLVTVIAGSACATLIAFADQAITFWTGDAALAREVAPVVRILALGTLFNTMMTAPYLCQLASGWTSLSNIANLVSTAIVIPALIWLVPVFGTIGAAVVWLGLNTGYLAIVAPISFRRVMTGEMWRWYGRDLLLPLAAAAAAATGSRALLHVLPASGGVLLLLIGSSGLLAALAAILAATEVRTTLQHTIRARRFVARTRTPAADSTRLPAMDYRENTP
jgi:O-antigen/teichoic acid export membrane protein